MRPIPSAIVILLAACSQGPGTPAADAARPKPAAPAPPLFWREAEMAEDQQGAAGEDRKAAAAGVLCLGMNWGAATGHYAHYRLNLPADIPGAVLHLRFARETAGESAVDVTVDKKHVGATPTLRLPSTGGWGDDPGDWRFASVPVGTLAAGRHTLRLIAAADGGNVNFDGFFLAPAAAPPAGLSDPAAFYREAGSEETAIVAEIRRRVPKAVDLPAPAALPRPAPAEADVAELLDEAARGLAPGVRAALAAKPAPWLVKAHDVGPPTDFNADIPWHALEKEKDERFPLAHRGELGLVNTNTDVSFLLGLSSAPAGGAAVADFNPPRRFTDHLVNLIAQDVLLDGASARVLFLPATSDTVLAVVQARNAGAAARTVGVEAVVTHPPVQLVPVDCYGYGIHNTTGRLQWIGTNAANGARVSSYDEWDRSALRPAGSLLCALAGSEKPVARGKRIEDPAAADAVLRWTLDVPPGGTRTLLVALTLHRFGPKRIESPMRIVLYPEETPEAALAYAVGAAVGALGTDWPGRVRESFRWYASAPAFRPPPDRASWAADLLCALELPRGDTWSAQGELRQPWYTFCRVHGHNAYGWWSYGMHGHEHLATHVVDLTEPALAQSFLRGHFQIQRADGFVPYGAMYKGQDASHDQEDATAPFLMGEAWTAYLWGGDRAFLAEAYAAGKKYLGWWRSPARTRPGIPLQHWRGFIETVRDDADLATWIATGGAERQEALDLNCYLLAEERTMAAMARELGTADEAAAWDADAAKRVETMRRDLWHAEDRVYYGRDVPGNRWARVLDISTFLPLWSGLATEEQTPRLLELLHDPEAFGTDYPVATLAVKHMPAHRRGEWHWRGSNWVEMTWLPVQGLRRYGCYAEAARVAEANCRMVFATLERSGHFREFYNSLTGAPTDLTDYIWTSIPAAMAVGVFYGVRPAAQGLEILPALPGGWDGIAVENLRVRGARIAIAVRRDPAAKETTATVDGAARPAHEGRGVFIPWSELPRDCAVSIVQPPSIPETIRDRWAPSR